MLQSREINQSSTWAVDSENALWRTFLEWNIRLLLLFVPHVVRPVLTSVYFNSSNDSIFSLLTTVQVCITFECKERILTQKSLTQFYCSHIQQQSKAKAINNRMYMQATSFLFSALHVLDRGFLKKPSQNFNPYLWVQEEFKEASACEEHHSQVLASTIWDVMLWMSLGSGKRNMNLTAWGNVEQRIQHHSFRRDACCLIYYQDSSLTRTVELL